VQNPVETQRPRTSWSPIVPVPEDAPQARISHPQRGQPARIFQYRDIEGRLLGYVCRFFKSKGGVATMPLTFCRNAEDQSRAWRWQAFPKLRPIYGAERLDRGDPEDGLGPNKIALVVADEFTVEELSPRQGGPGWRETEIDGALGKLKAPTHPFIAYDLVSWPGGRNKIGEVDWSPLRGRICAIWMPHSAERHKVAKGDPGAGGFLPIERQPWRVTARRLMETLREFGAVPVSIIEAETIEELPDGWNPLSALDSGWTLEQLAAWQLKHFATSADIEEARRLASGPLPPKPSAGDPEWMKSLLRHQETGRLLPELHNVRKILTCHNEWKGAIFLDGFAHSVQKAKVPPFEGGDLGEWSDTDDTMTADWLAERCGILKLKSTLVGEAVQTVAKLNAKNPVQDFLRGLKWDGASRLDTWLKEFMSAGPLDSPDLTEVAAKRLEEYLRIVGRKWLLGAVARALRPGCKFDYVLILEGQQGLGKSTAFSIIGGEWTMDTPFSLSDKEGMENIRGVWIVELPELDSFNKAESTSAKSFFSRTKDRFRLPYAKRSKTFLRSCVFGGTTNEDEYFRDPTGNRRYWPVHCSRKGYDKDALRKVRDQLLAEAVHAVLAGEQIWPSAAEERCIREQQRVREIPDPWVGRIARWLATPEAEISPITRERIMVECLRIEASRLDERSQATRVGKAMRKLGYRKQEDRKLPERFYYEKLQGSQEGDDE
jgi:putative DNA primase/helicase